MKVRNPSYRGRGGQILMAVEAIRVLTQGEALTPAELGQRLGVSMRTAYRALRALRQAGAPLQHHNGPRRYSMDRGEAWRWMMDEED